MGKKRVPLTGRISTNAFGPCTNSRCACISLGSVISWSADFALDGLLPHQMREGPGTIGSVTLMAHLLICCQFFPSDFLERRECRLGRMLGHRGGRITQPVGHDDGTLMAVELVENILDGKTVFVQMKTAVALLSPIGIP